MLNQFSEHFRLTDDEVKMVWSEAVFVFDTNVLLNLYRMRKDTSAKIIDILRKLKGRLFLPHQVGLEFFRHREDEIADQVNTFEKVRAYLARIPDQFKQTFSRHPCIPFQEIADALKLISDQQIQLVSESQNQNQLNFLDSADPILPQLAQIFGDCTGNDCEPTDDSAMNKKVDARIEKNLSPCAVFTGGKASIPSTANPHRGDGRVWFQIVEHAESVKKAIIFVTGDEKPNWWRMVKLGQHDRSIGPHFLLIRDVESASGKKFLMYTQEQFLANAPKYLGVPDQAEGIEETKRIREGAEEQKSSSKAASITAQGDQPKRVANAINKGGSALNDDKSVLSASALEKDDDKPKSQVE